MKAFRTLRGAVAGEEPDEPAYFCYSATLRILAPNLDFAGISGAIGLEPTRTHRRGERAGERSPPYRDDLWAYSPPLPEDRALHEHIDALWQGIRRAAPYLRDLKRMATVDVFLGYRSNIDHAGVEVPHTSLEMFVALEIPFGLSVVIA